MKNPFQNETNVKAKAVMALGSAVALTASLAPACFAETTTDTTVIGTIATDAVTAITSGLVEGAGQFADGAIDLISQIWPYVLGISIALAMFKFGKKFFKQLGK